MNYLNHLSRLLLLTCVSLFTIDSIAQTKTPSTKTTTTPAPAKPAVARPSVSQPSKSPVTKTQSAITTSKTPQAAKSPASTTQTARTSSSPTHKTSPQAIDARSDFGKTEITKEPNTNPNTPVETKPATITSMDVSNKTEVASVNLSTVTTTDDNFWASYGILNGRQCIKERRHCGCGNDITFYNPTGDTLDIFLSYMNSLEVPTLDDQVLQPLTTKNLIPNFYVLPYDKATIRGTCKGGIQYEAVSRKPRFQKDINDKGHRTYYNDPSFKDQGYVRFSCINKEVIFTNEVITDSPAEKTEDYRSN